MEWPCLRYSSSLARRYCHKLSTTHALNKCPLKIQDFTVLGKLVVACGHKVTGERFPPSRAEKKSITRSIHTTGVSHTGRESHTIPTMTAD